MRFPSFNVLCLYVTGFILIVYAVYGIIKQFLLKTGSSEEEESTSSASVSYLYDEDILTISLRKHLYVLQKVSQRISADRKSLLKYTPQRQMAFLNQSIEDLREDQSSFHTSLCKIIEQKGPSRDKHHEEIQLSLGNVNRELIHVQNLFQNLIADAEDGKKELQQVKRTQGLQTEHNEDYDKDEETIYNELMDSIATATKDCFDKVVTEAKFKGKEVIQGIHKYLEQSRKEIKKEISVFSFAASHNSLEIERTDSSLISDFVKVEKNLLETFIFLNRLRFEMQSLHESLTYFNGKFFCVSNKFDEFWRKSHASYEKTSLRLGTAAEKYMSMTKRVDENSQCLIQQSKDLKDIINMLNHILVGRSDVVETRISLKCAKRDPDILCSDRAVERCSQKLDNLQMRIYHSTKQVQSLSHVISKAGCLNILIQDIADGYDSLVCVLREASENQDFSNDRGETKEESKEHSCKTVEPARRENKSEKEILLGSFQDSDASKIVLSKGVEGASRHKNNPQKSLDKSKKIRSSENPLKNENPKCIPSEVLVEDVSRDILIPSSDELE